MISQLTPSNPDRRPEQPLPRPEVRPTLPEIAQRLPAPEAARSFYQPTTPDMPTPAAIVAERGYDNLGAMLHQMFIEADALPPQTMYLESPREMQSAYTSEKELWHDFLGLVMKGLKDSSTVHEIRLKADEHPEQIKESDISRLYHAYERSLRHALTVMKPDLNQPQRSELTEATTHLDWSFKDIIAQHVMAMSTGADELKYSSTDFLLLLDPGARKIEYTSAAEAQRLVNHFGSTLTKDTIKRDIGRAVPDHLQDIIPDEALALAA